MHLMQVVVPAGSPAWMTILALAIPILAGWLSNLAMDGLKQLIAKLDTSSTVVKQLVSIVVALLVGLATAKLGATLDPDLHNWTADGLAALLTLLAQQGIFRAKTNANLAKQGSATLEQRAAGAQPVRLHP